jgi:hypothetical protein
VGAPQIATPTSASAFVGGAPAHSSTSDLAQIIAFGESGKQNGPVSFEAGLLYLVAGTRNHRPYTICVDV